MIISHKYKFIFFKPTKVAGTSVEISLARNCGDKDVITPLGEYSNKSDEDSYEHFARNYEGFFVHIPPEEIKEKVSKKVWDSYFKFTIVRNPYDYLISRYWWEVGQPSLKIKWRVRGFLDTIVKNILKPKNYKESSKKLWLITLNKVTEVYPLFYFKFFLKNLQPIFINRRFYFDEAGKPYANFYIKFENLEKDFKKVCKKLGIPYSSLPKTKTKYRKSKKHFSEYYNNETSKIVAQKCKDEINYFKYTLNEKSL